MSTRPDQRLARKYRFDDGDMDLFFMAALSWGPAGGLDIGQAFHVASTIVDGDPETWVKSFLDYAAIQDAQADTWKARGWKRAAGEARLKAFASYRSAWQFATPGPSFVQIVERQRETFKRAMEELELPAAFFETAYKDKTLPGVLYRNAKPDAPLVLIIGGADTSYEDLFLGVGRSLFERGFSVAIVDLPGQGMLQAQGLYWEAEAEKPIAAVIDTLVNRFGVVGGRIALMGLSLGGYFVARAAGYEARLGAVIATTPFPRPHELFAKSVEAALASAGNSTPTASARRSREISLWKAGARTPAEFLERTKAMIADPSLVTAPFLSIVGTGDSPIFVHQAHEWHDAIRSPVKSIVALDASTGADGHCQVNNRLRLVQEVNGWLGEVF
jgi:alpha-beta hydrolase superfamily lysophospholipase